MRKDKIERWDRAHLLIHLQVSHQMKSRVSFIRKKGPHYPLWLSSIYVTLGAYEFGKILLSHVWLFCLAPVQ